VGDGDSGKKFGKNEKIFKKMLAKITMGFIISSDFLGLFFFS